MLSRLQEIALITRCIAGDDRDAYGRLVEGYADDIRRLLMSLTGGNVALVDDLSQETFIKAYLSLRSFNGIARFRTWIYRIAYNEFVSYMRRQRDHVRLDDLLTPAGEDQGLAGTDETQAEGITDVQLHQALMRLPESERVVTQLYYFDGFSVSRISSVTGMPSGTVKSYLYRARQKLAKLLQNHRN